MARIHTATERTIVVSHAWCGKRACRPGRPLCAKMRASSRKYQACTCHAYHFPHRRASGRCNFHPRGVQRQFEAFTGQKWDVAS